MKTYKINEELLGTTIKVINLGRYENVTYQQLKELERLLTSLEEIKEENGN